MIEYTITNFPDDTLFEKQCRALETHIPGIKKTTRLEDVDGSVYQFYTVNDAKIEVRNSYYLGGIDVLSEIDLSKYFKNARTTLREV